MLESLGKLVTESGFAGFFSNPDGWRNLVMIAIACVLLYLGIKKQYSGFGARIIMFSGFSVSRKV